MTNRSGNHKAPLYRKDNKTARGYRGDKGGDYRHARHTKQAHLDEQNEITRQSIKSKVERGRDYTPLFRFLLSRVGKDWDDVYSEAISRLDKKEPVFWMVALHEEDRRETVRLGESSYWSGLYVDDSNLLQKVNPDFTKEDFCPYCTCCTHTFNGEVVTIEHES